MNDITYGIFASIVLLTIIGMIANFFMIFIVVIAQFSIFENYKDKYEKILEDLVVYTIMRWLVFLSILVFGFLSITSMAKGWDFTVPTTIFLTFLLAFIYMLVTFDAEESGKKLRYIRNISDKNKADVKKYKWQEFESSIMEEERNIRGEFEFWVSEVGNLEKNVYQRELYLQSINENPEIEEQRINRLMSDLTYAESVINKKRDKFMATDDEAKFVFRGSGYV